MYFLLSVFIVICGLLLWGLPRTHNLCKQSYWFHPTNYGWHGIVLTCQPRLKLDDFLLLRNGSGQTLYRIIKIFVVSEDTHLSKVWVTFERRAPKEVPISFNSKYEVSQLTMNCLAAIK